MNTMTSETAELLNLITAQDAIIARAGIALVQAERALKDANKYNAAAVAERRVAVEAASANLGVAYDRLIEIRRAYAATLAN